MSNISAASAAQFANKQGIPLADIQDVVAPEFGFGKRYPLILKGPGGREGSHLGLMNKVAEAGRIDPTGSSQKAGTFAEQVAERALNALTADVHVIQGSAYATPSFGFSKKGVLAANEYPAFERLYRERVAEPAGLLTADAQAGMWSRLGPLTGMRSGGGDFTQFIEDAVLEGARKAGKSTDPESLKSYLGRVLAGKEPLPPLYAKGWRRKRP